ncbi:chemotaxis protein CheW [Motiliproteus sp. SC1-56]|uniref:chemotaxis protein CheW n=1 Tax=Motiliproteus sp. SC1-56 TaxID=2799565 RepID=UPI001A8F09C1
MHSAAAAERWISFNVGRETYAQPISAVKEVIPYTETVPVPGAPSCVDGILNVRGEVITVLCGAALFSPEDRGPEANWRIVILDTAHGHVGVSVDAVSEIVNLEREQIQPVEHGQNQELVVGTAPHGDQLLVLVDLHGYCERAGAEKSGVAAG